MAPRRTPSIRVHTEQATKSDLKGLRDNLKMLKNRKICEGRVVDVEKLNPVITNPFRTLGWNPILDCRGPIYGNAIKEFYATFQFNPDREPYPINFLLGETKYFLTLEQFGKLLGVPYRGEQFYSVGKDLENFPNSLEVDQAWQLVTEKPFQAFSSMKSSDFVPPHNMRYKIIDHNLYNREGNHNEVQAVEIALLWCLDTQTPVDLAFFIASRMDGVLTNGKRSMPYGMLLNSLFSGLGFQPQDLGPGKKVSHAKLDLATVAKMKRSLSKSKSKRRREEEDSESTDNEMFDYDRYVEDVGDDEAGPSRPWEDIPPEDLNDPFYAMDTKEQLSVIYRQQSGLKKMMSKILRKMSCYSQPPAP